MKNEHMCNIFLDIHNSFPSIVPTISIIIFNAKFQIEEMFRTPLEVRSSTVGMLKVKTISLAKPKKFCSRLVAAKGQLLPCPKMILAARQLKPRCKNEDFDPFPADLRDLDEGVVVTRYHDYFPKSADPAAKPSWRFVRLLQ